MTITSQDISAVILAGGRGSRLQGQDKGLLPLLQRPLITHVIERIKPQVAHIMISANRHLEDYRQWGFPVYPDATPDFAGPLAGILTALDHCKTEWLLSVPADSPFVSSELVARLGHDPADKRIMLPHDGEHLYPTFALLHHSLRDSLHAFLQQGERKAGYWAQQQPYKIVDFSDQANCFFNINTEADRQQAEKLLPAFMA